MRKILLSVFLLVLVIALVMPSGVYSGGKKCPPPPPPPPDIDIDIDVKAKANAKAEATGIGNVNVERNFLEPMFVGGQSIQAFFGDFETDGSSPLGIVPSVVTRKMAKKNRLRHNPIGIFNVLPIVKRWIPPFYSYKKDALVLHKDFGKKREKNGEIKLVPIPKGEKKPLDFLLGEGYLPIWANKIEGEPDKDADKLLYTSLIPLMNKGMTHFTVIKAGSKEVAKSESDSLAISGSGGENFTKSGVRGDLGAGLGDGQLRNKLEHWWHVVGMVFVPELAEAAKKPKEEAQVPPPPPAEKKVLAPVEAKEVVLLEAAPPEVTIYFDFNSFRLKPEEREKIPTMVKWLKEHSEYRLQAEGHACLMGSEDYNAKLARKRALAVTMAALNLFEKDYGLSREKVMPNLILQYVSVGEDKPVVENTTKEGGKPNRRVIFRIVGPASGQ